MIDEPHFLLVGDSTDLPAITGMLQRLPVEAAGQVYLEVASGIQIRPLPAPVGMTVTWLSRDRSPRVVPRGELAARAVAAWVSEWIPDDGPTPFVIWIGCSSSAPVTRLYRRLAERLGETRLHHPHHP